MEADAKHRQPSTCARLSKPNFWGVEDFEEITIRRSKYAASRFAHEAAPVLTHFADSSALPFVNGVKTARHRIADDEGAEFLRKRGSQKRRGKKHPDRPLEEGRKPESVFDSCRKTVAVERGKAHQDAGGARQATGAGDEERLFPGRAKAKLRFRPASIRLQYDELYSCFQLHMVAEVKLFARPASHVSLEM
jgi:hypothetical protein